MSRLLLHHLAKPFVFALCLLPLSWLLYLVAQDQLGANPQEALIRATGDWALRFLANKPSSPMRRSLAWLQRGWSTLGLTLE